MCVFFMYFLSSVCVYINVFFHIDLVYLVLHVYTRERNLPSPEPIVSVCKHSDNEWRFMGTVQPAPTHPQPPPPNEVRE